MRITIIELKESMKMIKKRKGITIIELLTSILILSVFMLVVMNTLKFSIFARESAETDFGHQSSLRYSIAQMSNNIINTKAVFLMAHNDFYGKKKKADWDYYALSEDKKKLINYKYNPDKTTDRRNPQYDEVVLFEVTDDNTLKLLFKKQIVLTERDKEEGWTIEKHLQDYTSSDEKIRTEEKRRQDNNKFVQIDLAIVDKDGNEIKHLDTEISSKVALIVGQPKGNLLSLYQDDIEKGIDVMAVWSDRAEDNVAVYMTLVLDASLSMRSNDKYQMTWLSKANYDRRTNANAEYDNVDPATFKGAYESRFDLLETALNGKPEVVDPSGNVVEKRVNGFLEDVSKVGDVFVTVIPYNDTANYPSSFKRYADNTEAFTHPVYNISNADELSAVKALVSGIDNYTYNSAGTNTGDGLRRAKEYHNHRDERLLQAFEKKFLAYYGNSTQAKQEAQKAVDEINKNLEYSILLTDGVASNYTNKFNSDAYDVYDGEGNVDGTNYDTKFDLDLSTMEFILVNSNKYANAMAKSFADERNNAAQTIFKGYVIGFSTIEEDKDTAKKVAEKMKGKYEEGDNYFDYENADLPKIFRFILNKVYQDMDLLKGPYY